MRLFLAAGSDAVRVAERACSLLGGDHDRDVRSLGDWSGSTTLRDQEELAISEQTIWLTAVKKELDVTVDEIGVFVEAGVSGGALLVIVELANMLLHYGGLDGRVGSVLVLPELSFRKKLEEDIKMLASAMFDYTSRGLMSWSMIVDKSAVPCNQSPPVLSKRNFGSRLYDE